jgi:hypothetical protein
MDALADFNAHGWQLLGLIIALGAVTMALLQLVIDLTPLRWFFQAYRVRRWIEKHLDDYERLLGNSNAWRDQGGSDRLTDVDSDVAFEQLIALATGGYSRSFGLSPPQLIAQINAAAQAALENPEANFSLLAALSLPAEPWRARVDWDDVIPLDQHFLDLARVVEASRTYLRAEEPERSKDPDNAHSGKAAEDPKKSTSAENSELKKYLDARARLANQIQRNLDGMQITLGYDSALANQISAIAISIVIAFIVVRVEQPNGPLPVLITLLVGIAAGYAAPLLGDIVAAIRRLGRT